MSEHYPFIPKGMELPKKKAATSQQTPKDRKTEGRKSDGRKIEAGNVFPPPDDNDLLKLEDKLKNLNSGNANATSGELHEEDYSEYFDYLYKDSTSDGSEKDELKLESRFIGSDDEALVQLAKKRQLALLLQQRRLKLRQQLLLQQQQQQLLLQQQQKKLQGQKNPGAAAMLQDGSIKTNSLSGNEFFDEFSDDTNSYKDTDYYDGGAGAGAAAGASRYDTGSQGTRTAGLYGTENLRKNYGVGLTGSRLGAGGGLAGLGNNLGYGDYDTGGGLDRSSYGGGGSQLVLLRQPQQQGGVLSNALGGLQLDYETFALLLALAGIIGAYIIYTLIIAKGRRRSFSSSIFDVDYWPGLEEAADMAWHALDDFENKLDGLAGALDHDPESWISKIYNSMTYSEQENSTELAIADVPNVTESLGEEDVDEVNNGNLSLDKRSVHPDDEETFETFLPTNSPKSDFDCNTRFAQCLSRTADGSILKLVWKFIGSFGTGIVNLATEGSTGFWKIFSNIPEAQFCLSAKRDCDFEVKKQKNSNFERPDSQKLKQEENQI